MPPEIVAWLGVIVHVIEFAGALALVAGFAWATGRYALERFGATSAPEAYERYRRLLAQTVSIGLEILVAATVIRTITLDQTLASVGVLAAMIAVRTLISWSIALELDGRWPWQAKD